MGNGYGHVKLGRDAKGVRNWKQRTDCGRLDPVHRRMQQVIGVVSVSVGTGSTIDRPDLLVSTFHQ
ncbi:hypothetical protein FH972_002952 [Carpinus fangiana]|uniref:Uncharacterized protein n=1 Tax=Carpinus fangiana TaxID=176857 RepID=A0A5N6QH06_9ROSI|nr:hypothetical protein FH972_002952 [Carpinus fangiana]